MTKTTENNEPYQFQAEPPRKFLQEEFLDNVSEEIQLSGPYLLLLVFSTLIAVLGLLTNSAAVVIGAMLISPLFWPILGITLSIITNKQRLARRSSINLIVSIGIVLLIGFIVSTVSPISQVTQEISARTNPTLLDLFIALSASVIGVLAIYNPRISQSTSGVAISIALLPPLCVSGIGIAFKSWEILLGSFLLFATNAGAIIFVGAITLYILKFRPKKFEDTQRMKIGFTASFIFLALLSLPLTYFLIQSINQNRTASQLNTLLKTVVSQKIQDARVEDIDITFPTRFGHSTVFTKATVLVPEGASLTASQQNEIITELSTKLNIDIDLELNLLNTLVLRREEDEVLRKLRQDIRATIVESLASGKKPINFESIEINFPSEETTESSISVLLVLRESYIRDITYTDKLELQAELLNTFNRSFDIAIDFIPIQNLSEQTEFKQFEERLVQSIRNRLSTFSSSMRLIDYELEYPEEELSLIINESSNSAVLGITSAEVLLSIETPNNYQVPENLESLLEIDLQNQLGVPISVTVRIVRYETL